jgi:acetyl esterase/lipase
MTTEFTPVHVTEKRVPPPPTISPIAQEALSTSAAMPRAPWPDATDIPAWRDAIAISDATWDGVVAPLLAATQASMETREIAGVPCYVATPAGVAKDARVYLYIHGGAFVFGGGNFAKAFGGMNADKLGIRTISVDYRMPPDHPFPAAPQDCLAVYRELIATTDPKTIVIGGSSAGGNLAAATTLMIRDQGLPLPAGVVLLTPEVDLTESGDTFATNRELDVVLKGSLKQCNLLYAGGRDLKDPYLSPVFADLSSFPPTLVQSGTRDLFLSNSVLIHRKLRNAGVDAELHVWEAMPHGSFGIAGTAPENAEIDAEVKNFIDRVCPDQ